MDWVVIFTDGTIKTYVNMSLYEVGQEILDEGKESNVATIINKFVVDL